MSWYNSSWSKRKKLTLTGGASGAQTDYQVKLTVTYDSDMQSDFSDLRFTKADGTTLIDSWMETYTTSTSAVIWVETDTPANTVDADIYMYYGNSGASSDWNFDNTFIFGDPFDNTTLDTGRWPSVDGTPVYSIDATSHYLEVTDMASGNWNNGRGFHSKALSIPSEWIVEDAYSSDGMRQYQSNTTNIMLMSDLFSMHNTSWSSTNYGVAFMEMKDSHSASAYVRTYAGVGGTPDYVTETLSTPRSNYMRMWKTSGDIHIELNGTERVNETNSDSINIVHLGLGRYSTLPFGTARFYAFKVRKYAVSPATYVFGSEEEEDEWYDLAWTERDKIIVTGNSSGAQTDYQIKIDILYDAAMNSDFSDLRFIPRDNSTVLDCWLESYTSETSANIWIKTDTPADGVEAIIYMYYGNSGASDVWSGVDTFVFFEPFEGTVGAYPTGWTGTNNTLYFKYSDTQAHSGSTCGELYANGYEHSYDEWRDFDLDTGSYVFGYFSYVPNNNFLHTLRLREDAPDNRICASHFDGYNCNYKLESAGAKYVDRDFDPEVWNKVEIIPNFSDYTVRAFMNDAYIGILDFSIYAEFDRVWLSGGVADATKGTGYIDDIYIRKYVDNPATYIFEGEVPIESEWGYRSWMRRKSITIVGFKSGSQTDYQMKINIPYDSDMNSDFSDLRFTEADGVTPLDSWLESYAESTSAVVWVKTDTPAHGFETNIYMYYNNWQVSDDWNGINTFELFDDFEGVINQRATATNLTRNESAYVYKDFGVNNFNALNIDFDANLVSGNGGICGILSLSNNINDLYNIPSPGVNVIFHESGGTYKIWLNRGPQNEYDDYICAAGTTYFMTLSRTESNDTITLEIYSDYARTVLLDTLSVSGFGTATRYRYLFPISSWDNNTSAPISCETSNISIDGAAIEDLSTYTEIDPNSSIETGSITDIDISIWNKEYVTTTINSSNVKLVGTTNGKHGSIYANELFSSGICGWKVTEYVEGGSNSCNAGMIYPYVETTGRDIFYWRSNDAGNWTEACLRINDAFIYQSSQVAINAVGLTNVEFAEGYGKILHNNSIKMMQSDVALTIPDGLRPWISTYNEDAGYVTSDWIYIAKYVTNPALYAFVSDEETQWLYGWERRKPITLTGGSSGAQTDYQVSLAVTYDSDMKSDFSDLRFTKSDGLTPLDAWLESYSADESAVIWVETDTPADAVEEIIYMYYRNSEAISDWDIVETFLFGNEFDIDVSTEFGFFGSTEYDRDTTTKISAAVSNFNTWELDFVVENGDFIDSQTGTKAQAITDLGVVEAIYDDLTMDRHYVFGNHDLNYLTKAEFFANTGKTERYYSFDSGDHHFIVLDDMCDVFGDDIEETSESNPSRYISTAGLNFLYFDLVAATKPSIVFVEAHLYGKVSTQMIQNADTVRMIMEMYGDVIACFHSHAGDNSKDTLNGIDYYSMKAMDTSTTNAYAKVTVAKNNYIYIEGIDDQSSYTNNATWEVGNNASIANGIATLDGSGANASITATYSTVDETVSTARVRLENTNSRLYFIPFSESIPAGSVVEGLHYDIPLKSSKDYRLRDDAVDIISGGDSTGVSTGIWHTQELVKSGTTWILNLDGNEKGSTTYSYSDLHPYYSIYAYNTLSDGNIDIDYTYVRKYAANPATYVFGDEESETEIISAIIPIFMIYYKMTRNN